MSASEAWELYGTLQFSKLVEEVLSNFIEKIEVIEGDGGVGSIIKLTFAPGMYHKHTHTPKKKKKILKYQGITRSRRMSFKC